MLEQEGLAVTIPRKGAEVAKMTEKDMEDVLQIRDALDELASSIACEQMTKEQLDTLTETMHEFEESTKSKDLKKITVCGCAVSRYYLSGDRQSKTRQYAQ